MTLSVERLFGFRVRAGGEYSTLLCSESKVLGCQKQTRPSKELVSGDPLSRRTWVGGQTWRVLFGGRGGREVR
jgi:hypothetical protein